MLQRTGEAETITTHYLFALGTYRALYIPNWIYRWAFDVKPFRDPIAVVAGIIQTVLYSDFFYIYYTKYVLDPFQKSPVQFAKITQGRSRQEVQPAGMN
jgi:ER lumen protein retaining receptor